jgi:nitric oxide synthase oxygenase domain/subunit
MSDLPLFRPREVVRGLERLGWQVAIYAFNLLPLRYRKSTPIMVTR